MTKRTIYFLFTDTGTHLSRMINYWTKESLNHVSIGFDNNLTEVYSFGRKRPRNPFIGGFVREDIKGDFLRDSECAVYAFHLTEDTYQKILSKIKRIEARESYYRYNFIGLFGVLLQIEVNRKYAYFCSEFVASVLSDTDAFHLSKPICFITPADIRNQAGMNLIYQGRLGDYKEHLSSSEKSNLRIDDPIVSKSSFMFLLSKKVKQLVIR